MELRQLRYFLGVVEAGSLLKASGRLHVAQPALGQQISALEDELGCRLFERSSRGMQLTEAGKGFVEHARLVLDDVERARSAVRQRGAAPAGAVAIGLPTTVSLSATVPLVRACREQLPQVQLKVVEAYSGYLREWLLAGRLDMALLFGSGADPLLRWQPLVDEGLALISRADRPADGRTGGRKPASRIGLRRLAGVPLVLPGREHGLRRIVDDACAAIGLELDVIAEVDSLPSVKRLVEVGVGSTILPLAPVIEEVAAGRLVASTIADASMRRRVALATNVSRPATRAVTAVAQLAVALMRERVAAGDWPGRWLGPPADGA